MLINTFLTWYLKWRMPRLKRLIDFPHQTQEEVLRQMVKSAQHTRFGKKYAFSSIKNPDDFAELVPISSYDDIKPYIQAMMQGEPNVLWNEPVKWFAKSSGTTSDKSKFIPVSNANLQGCHVRGSWDTMSLFYHNHPEATIFKGKSLMMGGSHSYFDKQKGIRIGDVSAIMTYNMPSIARQIYAIDLETAFTPDWESKIKKIAKITSNTNVTQMGGVPTWCIVLLRQILADTGKAHLFEVWKNMQLYIHGGVSFAPYREQFKEFFPSNQMNYLEVYNASEGYFGIQCDAELDMMLMLDNGVYYEFLPMSEWDKANPRAIQLPDVELGKMYALVISTNAGLWRYMIGDTIKFTSLKPYKFIITGRTKQFINTFGEEVMVENTDKALALTCQEFACKVKDYSVAPVFMLEKDKGGHEWLVEFEKMPNDLEQFKMRLDQNLQKVNSDYEAKRYKSLALQELVLTPLPEETFNNWLKQKGKYGGQHKIPRLSNSREYIDDIMAFVNQTSA